MSFNDLLSRAMRLLSQRDHSEVELRRKLAAQPFAAKLKAANRAKYQRMSNRDTEDNNSEYNDSEEDFTEERSFQRRNAKNNRFSRTSNLSADRTSAPTETLPEEPIDPALIEQVIAYCYQHNWLDDQRFSRVYLESRSRKGYGPQRIRAELLQKGVDKERVQLALEETEIDWGQQAKELAQRKFGDNLPTVWHEKAKLQRYLQYRGFFQEDIQSIYRGFE